MLFHYYSKPKYVKTLLENNTIWMSSFKKLNDPFEYYVPFFYDRKKSVVSPLPVPRYLPRRKLKAGLFCLSEENDCYLLWSHYSNGHRGICIGFEFSNFIYDFPITNPIAKMWSDGNKNVFLKSVDYKNRNKYALRDGRVDLLGEELIEVYSRKYSYWEYEHEHRLISFNYSDEYFKILPHDIKYIIWGVDTPKGTKKQIEDILIKNRMSWIGVLNETIDDISEKVIIK